MRGINKKMNRLKNFPERKGGIQLNKWEYKQPIATFVVKSGEKPQGFKANLTIWS